MQLPYNLSVSSNQFYWSAIVIALIDAALILLLVWRIKPARFRELRWMLVGTFDSKSAKLQLAGAT